jgi:hypothetical protein
MCLYCTVLYGMYYALCGQTTFSPTRASRLQPLENASLRSAPSLPSGFTGWKLYRFLIVVSWLDERWYGGFGQGNVKVPATSHSLALHCTTTALHCAFTLLCCVCQKLHCTALHCTALNTLHCTAVLHCTLDEVWHKSGAFRIFIGTCCCIYVANEFSVLSIRS